MHVVYLCQELVGLPAAEKSWVREGEWDGERGEGQGAYILHVVYSGYHAEPRREGVVGMGWDGVEAAHAAHT